MIEHFCTYNQSLALKELGININHIAVWETYKDSWNNYSAWANIDIEEEFDSERFILTTNVLPKYYPNTIVAPLKSQAFAFFREKFKMDSFVKEVYKSTVKVGYYFSINQEGGIQFQMDFDDWHKTYSEAENACINKLIEIVKTKKYV